MIGKVDRDGPALAIDHLFFVRARDGQRGRGGAARIVPGGDHEHKVQAGRDLLLGACLANADRAEVDAKVARPADRPRRLEAHRRVVEVVLDLDERRGLVVAFPAARERKGSRQCGQEDRVSVVFHSGLSVPSAQVLRIAET